MEKTTEELKKELADLRVKHSKVREFIIPADEDDESKVITFFLKPCDLKTETMIDKLAKKSRPDAVKAGFKALWLGGDSVDLLIENDYAHRAAEAGLVKYIAPAEVIVKKN